MRGCLLVLSLLVCSCQAFNYMGTAVTYHPLKGSNDTAVLRYKLAFRECGNLTVVDCPLDSCTISIVSVQRVFQNGFEWCQDEVIAHVNLTQTDSFVLRLDGVQWISVNNGITDAVAETRVEIRTRSDTNRPNVSPRTTVIPVLRVPNNCLMYTKLASFDPDSDLIECVDLTNNNPAFVHITNDCTLHYYPVTNSSMQGAYAIQLHVEDRVRDDLNLTDNAGNVMFLQKNNIIGRVPVQFVLQVDPPVESCFPGVYRPMFVPPTPEYHDDLYAFVNHTLEINIHTQATESQVTRVLFSGPAGITETNMGNGHFVLSWTPTLEDSGIRHALCFVAQAFLNQAEFHSETRCINLAVDHLYFSLDARFLSRSHDPYGDIKRLAIPALRRELIARGLPPDIVLRAELVGLKTLEP